jgi:hypothetical protein
MGASADKKAGSPEVKGGKAEAGGAQAAKNSEPKAPDATRVSTPLQPETSSANLALARVVAYKTQAEKKGFDAKSLFFRLGEAAKQEGQRYAAQSAPVEARSRFSVAEKVFRICLDEDKDADRLKALRKYAEGLRETAKGQSSGSSLEELLAAAAEKEKNAASLQEKKEIEKAANGYIQAAVAYHKILLSLPSVKK